MPLIGYHKNLSSDKVNTFFEENFAFNNTYICASGIEDHEEFVKLVEKNMINYNLSKKNNSLKKKKFCIKKRKFF